MGLWREAWGGGAGLMQEKREVQKVRFLKDKGGAC